MGWVPRISLETPYYNYRIYKALYNLGLNTLVDKPNTEFGRCSSVHCQFGPSLLN